MRTIFLFVGAVALAIAGSIFLGSHEFPSPAHAQTGAACNSSRVVGQCRAKVRIDSGAATVLSD